MFYCQTLHIQYVLPEAKTSMGENSILAFASTSVLLFSLPICLAFSLKKHSETSPEKRKADMPAVLL